MTFQCMSDRRIGDFETLRLEIGARSSNVSEHHRDVERCIRIADGLSLNWTQPRKRLTRLSV